MNEVFSVALWPFTFISNIFSAISIDERLFYLLPLPGLLIIGFIFAVINFFRGGKK